MISVNNKQGISSQHQIDQDIELTPLIDVIFIVIVFLLLTANARLLLLPVTVPETDKVENLSKGNSDVITISVSKDDSGWSIDEEYFADWVQFKNSITEIVEGNSNTSIALAADQEADVQRFVKVLVLLQQQSVSDTRIIVNEAD